MSTKPQTKWVEVKDDFDDEYELVKWTELEQEREGMYLNREQVGPKQSWMYFFDGPDGKWKTWGTAILDKKLASAIAGMNVRIRYDGLTKTRNGMAKLFSVFLEDLTEGDHE